MNRPHSIHISTFPFVRLIFFLATFCSVSLYYNISISRKTQFTYTLYYDENNLLARLLILDILLPLSLSISSKKNGSWILGEAYAKHVVMENNLFSFN